MFVFTFEQVKNNAFLFNIFYFEGVTYVHCSGITNGMNTHKNIILLLIFKINKICMHLNDLINNYKL